MKRPPALRAATAAVAVALPAALVWPATAAPPEWRFEMAGGVPVKLLWRTEPGPAYYLFRSGDLADLPYSAPAGTFPANCLRLHEAAGNVREWCWDRYAADYYAGSPDIDPKGPETGLTRVFRDFDYAERGLACRTARRRHNVPNALEGNTSFRPVRAILP